MPTLSQKLSNAVRGIPGVSAYSFEMLVRRPKSLARFQADVARARHERLGTPLPPITAPKLLEWKGGEYSLRFSMEDTDFDWAPDFQLLKAVALSQPKTAFEIGTYRGYRTALMASQALDCQIYTLDLPPDAALNDVVTDMHLIEHSKSVLGESFRGKSWEKRITQLFGDSMEFDFSPYTGKMDLIYIDGSHSWEYVVSDTHNAVDMCRPEGGLIVWDDYGSQRAEYGVTRYLEGLRADGYPVWRLGNFQYAAMRVTPEVRERFRSERPR